MPDVLEPPQPTPPTTPSPALEDFDRTFADLDTPAPTPEPPPTPTPDETQARATPPKDPATGKFTKTEPGIPETGTGGKRPLPVEPTRPDIDPKGTAKADTLPKGTEFTPPQVAKPSELRNWAQRMGTRAEQAEKQLTQLNHKIRELESRQPQHADTKALTEELASTKKRLEEYEGELKVTRYERSGEYKEKYEKPYQNAVRNAYNEVQELLVTVPNPNDPENPQERQATVQDFDEVYGLPLGQATKVAKQKFGDAASIVIQHVKAIKDAKKAAFTAIEEHKGKAAEFEQQQTAQQKMVEEGRSRMFGEAVNAIVEKYKDVFGERDGDTAWNEALAKGRHMADLAFSDRQGLTPAQSAILDAQIHARVSAFPGLRAENSKLKAERDALAKEIEELRGSSPGKTAPAAPKTEAGNDNMPLLDAFDKMVPG